MEEVHRFSLRIIVQPDAKYPVILGFGQVQSQGIHPGILERDFRTMLSPCSNPPHQTIWLPPLQ